jgi:ABC-2 type transport system ATP-binding protein
VSAESAAGAPFLSAAGVSYRYRGAAREALSDISFAVPQGACFGLLGPNGAGKTTLFSLMTGMAALQSGDITVGGVSTRTNLHDVRAMGALAPQDLAFYPALTGRQNLSFFAGVYRMNARDWRERLDQCVTACQLAGVLDRRAETYSGGEKRRLNLAIALLNAPRILYLDEPTVGIDARSRHAIVEAIAALKAQRVTIIYTSHYMEEVEQLCDELMVIDQGRIVAIGGKEELLKRFAPSALVVTLERPVAKDSLRALGPIWQDETRLTVPIASAAELPRVLKTLNDAGAAVAQARYGAARLEQAYLAMIGAGEAA